MYDSRSCKRASLAVPPLLAVAAAARRLSFFSCSDTRTVIALHAHARRPRMQCEGMEPLQSCNAGVVLECLP